MKHSETPAVPSLILTIGSSLVPAIMEARRILLQGQPQRDVITRFLALNILAEKAALAPIDKIARETKPAVQTREQAREQTARSVEEVTAGIRSALHDLRAHEKLMEAGLGGSSILPLDVIVAADLSEPDAVSLEPILSLLTSLLEHEPYARIHLLLDMAVFDENSRPVSNVHDALQSLQTFLKESDFSCIPQIYLFDRYKEGVWEAHNKLEVQTILGNFLMALLSGGLAQYLAHQVSLPDLEERQSYFCGASATALTFDPEQLQRACAMRLGAQIIEAEFHSKIIPDPEPALELAGEFESSHANPGAWTERLCRDSAFHAFPGGMEIELHVSDLQFEGVPMQDWSGTIRAYDSMFKGKRFPVELARLKSNAGEAAREFLAEMTQFILALPQQTRLYPGGVRASQIVIEKLRQALISAQFDPMELSDIEQEWNAKISASLDTLEREVQSLPKPPRWLFRLPGFLRAPAIQLFNMIFLYREHTALTKLRQSCVRLMEQKYEALAKEEIARKLTELSKGWIAALNRHARNLKRLQTALDKLQRQCGRRADELTLSSSQFRLSALDESVLTWAFYYGDRPREGFRHALLNDFGYLADWQRANGKDLEEGLGKFCMEVYKSLSNVDLEEALHHRDGKDADVLALSLLQGSIPLLRPNFDQTGGGSSFQLRFLQCRDPLASSLYAAFKDDAQEWEFLNTADPLLAICCRVRMMIPRAALAHIFEHGNSNGGGT